MSESDKSGKREKPLTIYIVTDPKGKLWQDTVATTYDQCRINFVKCICGFWNIAVDYSLYSAFWSAFERVGFEIKEIETPFKP